MLEEPKQEVPLLRLLQRYGRIPYCRTLGAQPPRRPPVEQKNNLIISLKRKAEDRQLTSTQHILTETLSSSTPDLNVTLHKLEILARVSQRARATSSGSVNHPEALTSAEFELPPSCQLTQRDEDFVAYYGRTKKGPGGI